MNTITEGQWAQELETLGVFGKQIPDEGRTTEEWMDYWKCGLGKARRKLNQLKKAGLLIIGTKPDENIDGYPIQRKVRALNIPAIEALRAKVCQNGNNQPQAEATKEATRQATPVAKGKGNTTADRRRR